METMWRGTGRNKTPKGHLLFCETMRQLKQYNGIADKVEDFVEKVDQQGKKLENIVKRMPRQCYRQQHETIFKRRWLQTDPAVEAQRLKVEEQTKRKRKQVGETAEDQKRDLRRKRRRKTITLPFYSKHFISESEGDEDRRSWKHD